MVFTCELLYLYYNLLFIVVKVTKGNKRKRKQYSSSIKKKVRIPTVSTISEKTVSISTPTKVTPPTSEIIPLNLNNLNVIRQLFNYANSSNCVQENRFPPTHSIRPYPLNQCNNNLVFPKPVPVQHRPWINQPVHQQQFLPRPDQYRPWINQPVRPYYNTAVQKRPATHTTTAHLSQVLYNTNKRPLEYIMASQVEGLKHIIKEGYDMLLVKHADVKYMKG